jgi:hypothetical protein
MSNYQHTQPGTLLIVVFVIGVIAILAATLPAPGGARWIGLPLALLFAVLAWLFSSLTVTVSGDALQWYFGPGVWKYRLPRADIAAVSIVRNSVLNGFGIRMRPGFRLYNVSGLDAVELQLKSGEIRRIGTDDAGGLAPLCGPSELLWPDVRSDGMLVAAASEWLSRDGCRQESPHNENQGCKLCMRQPRLRRGEF